MDFQKGKKTKEKYERKKEREGSSSLSFSPISMSSTDVCNNLLKAYRLSTVGRLSPARVNPRPKKINFFVPSNITFHYTCYRSILKAILMPAEERSAIFSRHSKLHKHPSYLKNGSSVFHTISILSSPLIITFLITFWIFSLSKDSILMILSNCVSNLLEELSSGGISVLSCSIS